MARGVEKPDLYVGCGLTGAPEDFVSQVDILKERLKEEWEVMEFLGLGEAQPGDVYRKDIIENVGDCKCFLGVADERATGLGYELCMANVLKKPALVVAHESARVTRLITDAPIYNPNMRFRRYGDMVEDVPRILLEEFEVVVESIVKLRV